MTSRKSAPPDKATLAALARKPRPRDPHVASWTESQGPRLDLSERTVFMLLSTFANPDTGECWPSQDLLAYILDCHRTTVNRALTQIMRSTGDKLLTKRYERSRSGGWSHAVYRLSGVDTGWNITEEKGDRSAIITMAERFEERTTWFHHILEIAQKHGLDHGIPDEIVAAVYMDMKEREEPDEYVADGYIPEDPPSPEGEVSSLSEDPVEVPERGTPPAADPVVEFVDANLDRIVVGRDQGGFDHRGGAIRVFRESPAEFERWKRMLEADQDQDQDQDGHVGAYFRRYGYYPWEKDEEDL